MSGLDTLGLQAAHDELEKKIDALKSDFEKLKKDMGDWAVVCNHIDSYKRLYDQEKAEKEKCFEKFTEVNKLRADAEVSNKILAEDLAVARNNASVWKALVDDLRNTVQKLRDEKSLPTDLKIMSWNVTRNGVTMRVEAANGDPRNVSFHETLKTPEMIARLIRALTSYLAGEFRTEGETRGSHGGG